MFGNCSSFRGFKTGRVRLENVFSCNPRSSRRASSSCFRARSLTVPVVAYHHEEDAKDWRVKQMMKLCNDYFARLWSKGEVSIAGEILDPDFIHHDRIWRKKEFIAGPESMKDFIIEMRKAYPNLHVEAVDFADGSIEHIFVQFEGSGTSLGRIYNKPPSGHHSAFTGVGIFRFNHDRSRIKEVDIWRTPTKEDKIGGVDAEDLFEVHLSRLHFD